MSSQLSTQEVDALLDQVLDELANPPAAGVERRLKERFKMDTTLAQQPRLLSFPAPGFAPLSRTGGMSPRSVTLAAFLNIAAVLLFLIGFHTARQMQPRPMQIVSLLAPIPPPPAPPRLHTIGGGGGQPGVVPVTQGSIPRPSVAQLNLPKVPPMAQPRIVIPTTVDVQANLKMAETRLPSFGVPASPLVGMSLGNGRGGGIGPGTGNGVGPGAGGNIGGGLRRIGGGVSAPVVLFAPEPEFSEEARKARAAGNVLVYLQVDTQGRPSHVRVLKGIGLGLDEKAVEAVNQYKFKPAMEGGKPVPVEVYVNVGFQIY